MRSTLYKTTEFDFENVGCFDMPAFFIIFVATNEQDLIRYLHTYHKSQAIIQNMCGEVYFTENK